MATPSKPVLSAIATLGRRVTAADVAATTGMALNVVTRELNRIASDTEAVLQVSPQGTIAYVFATDPAVTYQAIGLQKLIHGVVDFALKSIFFVVRISFGLLLIASMCTLLVIFATALALILFAADASDGDIGDLEADLDFDFFDVFNLGCFFSWWQFDIEPYEKLNYYGKEIDTREKGFLFNCFSFLFGDGNPNRRFDEQCWKYIAEVIRQNNGVITAEQIAPYVEEFKGDTTMCEVMVRFDGRPEVTETGNIVYVFPTMQTTAAGHLLQELPLFAEAKQWKFSEEPIMHLSFVFFFAFANLAGWYGVYRNLHHFSFLMQYMDAVKLMLAYAGFFLIFPILRSFVNAVRNGIIEFNNNRRKRSADLLGAPQMRQKLLEANAFAQRLIWHNPAQVAYTTDRDYLEQQFPQ